MSGLTQNTTYNEPAPNSASCQSPWKVQKCNNCDKYKISFLYVTIGGIFHLFLIFSLKYIKKSYVYTAFIFGLLMKNSWPCTPMFWKSRIDDFTRNAGSRCFQVRMCESYSLFLSNVLLVTYCPKETKLSRNIKYDLSRRYLPVR